jgi:hypothetical protein
MQFLRYPAQSSHINLRSVLLQVSLDGDNWELEALLAGLSPAELVSLHRSTVRIGLGHIVALRHRASTLYQTHGEIRFLCI